MYKFTCDGFYSYDAGGQIYTKDKCLVTDEVQKVLKKVMKILKDNPNFEFDIIDGDCNERSWTAHTITDMWSLEKVKKEDEESFKKVLSVNNFEYDITDTVAAVYNNFKKQFTSNDLKILSKVFEVSVEEDKDDIETGMTVAQLKKLLTKYSDDTKITDIEELEMEFI